MNRVLSILAVACFMAANVGAAPVPNHQQPQVKNSAIPMAPRSAQNQTHKSSKAEPKPYQVGTASWYGKQFHGKTTASGEDFDMFEFTAAHRKLPLGSFVKVTNLKNGKWIIVRVNDRGPYTKRFLIDLSPAAAAALGLGRKGTTPVEIKIASDAHHS